MRSPLRALATLTTAVALAAALAPVTSAEIRELPLIAVLADDLGSGSLRSDDGGPYLNGAGGIRSVVLGEINYFLDAVAVKRGAQRRITLDLSNVTGVYAAGALPSIHGTSAAVLGSLNTSPSSRDLLDSASWLTDVPVGGTTYRRMQFRFTDSGRSYFLKFGYDEDADGDGDSDEVDVTRVSTNSWRIENADLPSFPSRARLYTTKAKNQTGLLLVAEYVVPVRIDLCAPTLGSC